LAPGREGEHLWVAYDFPGLKAFYAGSGADRGMVVYLGQIYKVSGTSLISITSAGVATVRGSVPGSASCIFAISYDDAIAGYGLLIATEGKRYYYNQSTVTEITDADLSTGYSVAVINDVAIYDNLDGILTHSTNAAPTTISAFFAETNTTPDGIVRVYVWGQIVFVFGSASIEQWFYNGATTEFIFTRQEQATIPIGLAAKDSLASDELYMYFLGSDRQFKKLRGSLPEPISSPGIANELARMTTVDDCRAWCMTIGEQSYYVATFPTEGKSFLYSSTYNYWVNLAYGTDSDNPARYLGNSYVYAYNRHFVADYRNGNVYELDPLTYTDAGNTRLRIFVLSPMTGTQIGLPGRNITVSSLELQAEVGVGLTEGQGIDALIMCQVSWDGGKTFSEITEVSLGELGAYTEIPKYDRFATGRSIVYRILCSDPIYLSIFGGIVEVTDGGF
jgi:hypothetical protein